MAEQTSEDENPIGDFLAVSHAKVRGSTNLVSGGRMRQSYSNTYMTKMQVERY